MVEDTILLPKGEDGIERVKVEIGVKKGADIRPIGCDVPLGQVCERKATKRGRRERKKERKTMCMYLLFFVCRQS